MTGSSPDVSLDVPKIKPSHVFLIHIFTPKFAQIWHVYQDLVKICSQGTLRKI